MVTKVNYSSRRNILTNPGERKNFEEQEEVGEWDFCRVWSYFAFISLCVFELTRDIFKYKLVKSQDSEYTLTEPILACITSLALTCLYFLIKGSFYKRKKAKSKCNKSGKERN